MLYLIYLLYYNLICKMLKLQYATTVIFLNHDGALIIQKILHSGI